MHVLIQKMLHARINEYMSAAQELVRKGKVVKAEPSLREFKDTQCSKNQKMIVLFLFITREPHTKQKKWSENHHTVELDT